MSGAHRQRYLPYQYVTFQSYMRYVTELYCSTYEDIVIKTDRDNAFTDVFVLVTEEIYTPQVSKFLYVHSYHTFYFSA